jgi:hypothetical protein
MSSRYWLATKAKPTPNSRRKSLNCASNSRLHSRVLTRVAHAALYHPRGRRSCIASPCDPQGRSPGPPAHSGRVGTKLTDARTDAEPCADGRRIGCRHPRTCQPNHKPGSSVRTTCGPMPSVTAPRVAVDRMARRKTSLAAPAKRATATTMLAMF